MNRQRASIPETLANRPLPLPFRRFLDLYQAGRFWDAHETLEDSWRAGRSDFYQALILYASAWVHWERRNAHGVGAQLKKALHRLAAYPSSYLGIDVAALRSHCMAVRAIVSSDEDTWHSRVQPMPLTLSATRLRGDEVELT